MAFEIDFTDQTGTTGFAHKELLLRIQALAELNGWTTLRYATGVAPTVGTGLQDELILQGEGLSADKEIFIGFRTYENASADYYNITAAGFTGYIPGEPWVNQPGMIEKGIPAHNQHCSYWLVVDAQRILIGMGVGAPVVYESGGAGFFLPYASPNQYGYPMFVAGMLNGAAAVRYSDVSHSMAWKGNTTAFVIRNTAGAWIQPRTWPWSNERLGGSVSQLRDTNDEYPILPIEVYETTPNWWGVLDGIGYVSNFNNTVESMVQVGGTPVVDNPAWTSAERAAEIITAGGTPWVCLQDVGRTSFNDYFALRLS